MHGKGINLPDTLDQGGPSAALLRHKLACVPFRKRNDFAAFARQQRPQGRAPAHELQWSYRYPNGYVDGMVLGFEAVFGQRYRLGQRFFPQPHPDGPMGAIVDFAARTVLLPIRIIVPPEPPQGPPEGEYYSRVVATLSRHAVGRLAPDVPLEHPPITYVPVDQPDP